MLCVPGIFQYENVFSVCVLLLILFLLFLFLLLLLFGHIELRTVRIGSCRRRIYMCVFCIHVLFLSKVRDCECQQTVARYLPQTCCLPYPYRDEYCCLRFQYFPSYLYCCSKRLLILKVYGQFHILWLLTINWILDVMSQVACIVCEGKGISYELSVAFWQIQMELIWDYFRNNLLKPRHRTFRMRVCMIYILYMGEGMVLKG